MQHGGKHKVHRLFDLPLASPLGPSEPKVLRLGGSPKTMWFASILNSPPTQKMAAELAALWGTCLATHTGTLVS